MEKVEKMIWGFSVSEETTENLWVFQSALAF